MSDIILRWALCIYHQFGVDFNNRHVQSSFMFLALLILLILWPFFKLCSQLALVSQLAHFTLLTVLTKYTLIIFFHFYHFYHLSSPLQKIHLEPSGKSKRPEKSVSFYLQKKLPCFCWLRSSTCVITCSQHKPRSHPNTTSFPFETEETYSVKVILVWFGFWLRSKLLLCSV